MPDQKESLLLILSLEFTHNIRLFLPIALIIETITYGQILSLIIKAGFYSTQSHLEDWIQTIKDILSSPSLFEVWNPLSSESFAQAFWFFCMIYLLFHAFAVIVVVLLALLRTRNYSLSRFLTILSLVHSRVLFLPIYLFFLQTLQLPQPFQNNKTGVLFNNIGGSVTTICFAVINFSLALLKELFFYRIDKDKSAYASKTNFPAQLMLLYKAFAATILQLNIDPAVTSKIVGFATLPFSLVLIYILTVKLPYYNVKLMQYSYALLGIFFSFAIFGFVKALAVTDRVSEPLIVVSVPFMGLFFYKRLRYMFEDILLGKFNSPEKAIHFPILLRNYTSNYDFLISVKKIFPLESIYFYSFCLNNVLSYDASKNIKCKDLLNHDFYFAFIKRCGSLRINYKHSEAFLLYISRILLKKLGNTFQALNFLEETKELKPSIPVRASIANLYSSFKASVAKPILDENNNLDIDNYFIYREDLTILKKDMEEEVKCHLEFWKEISQDKVFTKKVIDIADRIDVIYKKIKVRWNQNVRYFQSAYAESFLLYGLYQDFIRGLPYESIQLLKKYNNHKKTNEFRNKTQIVTERSAIILASIEKARLGTVIDASDTVQSVFGISRDRIINMKITSLMPGFVAKYHDKYMQKYTHRSGKKDSPSLIRTYGKTPLALISELEIEIKVYPYLDKGVNLLGHIKQVSPPEQALIVKGNGNIMECSLSLQKAFKISGTSLDMVKIHDICPQFDRVNAAFNMCYGTKETKTTIQDEPFPSLQTQKDRKDVRMTTTYKTDLATLMIEDQNLVTFKTKEDEVLVWKSSQPFTPTVLMTSSQPISPSLPFLTQNSAGVGKSFKFQRNESATKSVVSVPLNEEEAKGICKSFEDGSTLKFYPYLEYDDAKGNGVSFNVSIKPYIFEKNLYKVIRIVGIEGGNLHAKGNPEDMSNPASLPTVIKSSNMDKMKESKIDDISEVPDEIPKSEFEVKRIQSNSPDKAEKAEEDIETKKLMNELENIIQTQAQNHKSTDLVPANVTNNSIKNIIQKQQTMAAGSTTTSFSNMNLKLIRSLNDVFEVRQIRPVTKFAILGVYLVLLAVMVSLFVNLSITQQSLSEIQSQVGVINLAGARLNKAIVAWEWLLMLYARLLGLRRLFAGFRYTRGYVYNQTLILSQLNKDLRMRLNTLENDDVVNAFSMDTIKFYDQNGDRMAAGNLLDTFVSTEMIILPNLFIGKFTDSDDILVKRPEFIINTNNTANDYLVQCEAQMKLIYNTLETIIENNISQSKMILAIEQVGLFSLCAALFMVARVVMRSYGKVFQALVRVSNRSINEKVSRIKVFEGFLHDETGKHSFIKDSNYGFFNYGEKKSKQRDTAKNKNGYLHRTFYSRGLTVYLGQYMFIALAFIVVISGIFVALFFQSVSSFNTLSTSSEEIYLINRLNYQNPLVVGNYYYEVVFQNNSKMLIRNEAAKVQMDKNMETLSQINEQLIAAFSIDAEELSDPIINGVLKGNLCRYLSADMQANCDTATEGSSLGLLGLNSKSYKLTSYYIEMYRKSPTEDNAKLLLAPFFDAGVSLDFVLDATYSFLIGYILGRFNNEVDTLEEANLLLSWGAAIIIFITIIAIQMFVIRKFIELDSSQRKIFKVLTYQVFSQNKALAFLLRKEFDNEIEGLGKILAV